MIVRKPTASRTQPSRELNSKWSQFVLFIFFLYPVLIADTVSAITLNPHGIREIKKKTGYDHCWCICVSENDAGIKPAWVYLSMCVWKNYPHKDGNIQKSYPCGDMFWSPWGKQLIKHTMFSENIKISHFSFRNGLFVSVRFPYKMWKAT